LKALEAERARKILTEYQDSVTNKIAKTANPILFQYLCIDFLYETAAGPNGSELSRRAARA
jgi:hypothetical protein